MANDHFKSKLLVFWILRILKIESCSLGHWLFDLGFWNSHPRGGDSWWFCPNTAQVFITIRGESISRPTLSYTICVLPHTDMCVLFRWMLCIFRILCSAENKTNYLKLSLHLQENWLPTEILTVGKWSAEYTTTIN